jgi:hypothetical protein
VPTTRKRTDREWKSERRLVQAWLPIESVERLETLAVAGERSLAAELRLAVRLHLRLNEVDPGGQSGADAIERDGARGVRDGAARSAV